MPAHVRIEPGMRVRLKKPHPCGGHDWEILRGGIDIKARCLTCSRIVSVNRHKFARRICEFLSEADDAAGS